VDCVRAREEKWKYFGLGPQGTEKASNSKGYLKRDNDISTKFFDKYLTKVTW